MTESLARFADAMPNIAWVAVPRGEIEFLNRNWTEYTGAEVQQGLGQAWVSFVHPDDRLAVIEQWQRAVETGEPFEARHRLMRGDGSYLGHICRAQPQHDESGTLTQWFGSWSISNQEPAAPDTHQADSQPATMGDRLIHQTDFVHGITQSIAQGLYAVDLEGRATFVNPAAEVILGWRADELMGRDMHSVIHFQHADHSHFPREVCPLLDVLRNGQIQRCDDDVFTRRDGTVFAVTYTSAPIIEQGRIIGAVIAFADVSDQKRQAQALIESREEIKRYAEELERRVDERTAELTEINVRLRASNRELQDFASVASHDLQEPLRKIQAFGDRLMRRAGPALGPEGQDYLLRMKNAAGRMQSLISDLLAFSRVTTKAHPFAMISLKQVAAEVLEDLESSVEKHAGRVEVGDMPAIEADAMQMRQLLQNLIGNALKFRRADVPPVVRLDGSVEVEEPTPERPVRREVCRIVVQDNGIGFDEKYLDRIFNVFQRLHGRHEYEGTGIGLAVCRKIAERHGGSITARSTPGLGSTFIVTLPTRHPEGAAAIVEGTHG